MDPDALMNVLLIVLPLYFLLFLVIGTKSLKHFLIFTAIVSIPLEMTYSLIYEGPRDDWVAGIQLSLSDLSFMMLFVYLLCNHRIFTASKRMLAPILFFISACALSVINSNTMRFTLYQVIMVSALSFFYYYVFSNAIESEQDVNLVLRAFMVSLIFQGVIATAQFLTGNPLDLFTTGNLHRALIITSTDSSLVRAQGTAPYPNGFAAYLVPIILLNISLATGIAADRALRLVSIFLGLLALLFSFSRGGWLSFMVDLMLFCFYALRSHLLRSKHVVAVLLIILTLTPLIFLRNLSNDSNAAMSRLPLITLAFNMVSAHPFIGIGANTYSSEIRNYFTPELVGVYLDQVHNMYLLIFAEIGILGMAAFIWLLATLVRQSKALLRRDVDPYIRYIGLGIALGVTASATHMMFDMFNSRVLLGSLFAQAGIITSLHSLSEKDHTEKAQRPGFHQALKPSRPTFADRGVGKTGTPLYEYWKSRSTHRHSGGLPKNVRLPTE